MELGSEFNLDLHDLKPSRNSFFRDFGDMTYRLFDSGRSALKAVSLSLRSGSVLMPELMCESVLGCFPEDRIVFYRLKNDLQIDTDDLTGKIGRDTAAVYLMHYFGSLQPAETLSLLAAEKEKYGFTIIEDTTHSLFSKKRTVGDYCVASLRKWLAVPDGGILYPRDSLNSYDGIRRNTNLDKAYAMMLKTLYLNGKLDCKAEYRKIFAECENRLDAQKKIRRISDCAEFLLGCYEVDVLVKRRRSNLKNLKSGLDHIGIRQVCDFAETNCPFALAVTVPDRDNFRRYLMENNIYCAVHWPFDGRAGSERPLAATLSNSIISLPIDQRYGKKEMAYLSEVINAYKGRLTF